MDVYDRKTARMLGESWRAYDGSRKRAATEQVRRQSARMRTTRAGSWPAARSAQPRSSGARARDDRHSNGGVMFDQQLDLDGAARDLEVALITDPPEHETVRLFDSPRTMRGQIALDTDPPAVKQDVAVRLRSDPAHWWDQQTQEGR
jgi:hypothetical protein